MTSNVDAVTAVKRDRTPGSEGTESAKSSEESVFDRIEAFRRRRPRLADDVVTMANGAGGKATAALVESIFLPAFSNEALEARSDAAVVETGNGGRLAFSTDSFVVKPIRFPGGSIGDLAVNGTINDLAVVGARPLALSAAFVLEEGFPVDELREVVADMARAAAAAGVPIVAGDTKVVEHGSAEGMYISTAGFGAIPEGRNLSADSVNEGDVVLVSGTIGDHGTAVLLARGDLVIEGDVSSDTAPLNELTESLIEAAPSTRWMRDATRGGVGTVCNELAHQSETAVVLYEREVPVLPQVAAACELLGIDPLYVANEGKLVAVVAREEETAALKALKAHPLGKNAAAIGEIRAEPKALVVLATSMGGTRIVDMLVGDPLPRIC